MLGAVDRSEGPSTGAAPLADPVADRPIGGFLLRSLKQERVRHVTAAGSQGELSEDLGDVPSSTLRARRV